MEIDRFNLTGQIDTVDYMPAFSGHYSTIYRAKWGEKLVAVKVLNQIHGCNLGDMKRKVRRERVIWESLEHPNILPFYGHADDGLFAPFGAFISPWCSNGDAAQFLRLLGREMEAARRLELWKGVLTGVAFLHSRIPVIVHGDLKPGNILIDDDGNPRICDFGLARIIQEDGIDELDTPTEHTGTERYIAPELVNHDISRPTIESDHYGLGCLGLEFIYLESPYGRNMRPDPIIMDISQGIPPAIRQENIHSPLDIQLGNTSSWELIKALWSKDPADRPTASFVLSLIAHQNSDPNPDTPIVDYKTAASTPSWLEGQQKVIERARLWYGDAGPLAKAMNEEPTVLTKGHWRGVQLIALNFKLSETSMMVDRSSTFSQIGFQLHTSNAATIPVALEQISGPFPRWRIPNIDSRVPQGLQKIYVADISEPFTLTLVRDVEEDFPLLLPLASFNTSTITMGDLIGASLGGRAKAGASVRLLSSSRDIQNLTCNLVQEEIKEVYSTTLFVHLNSNSMAYMFCNKCNSPVPPALRLAFPLCRSLVESAPRSKAFDFQAIGLSRALLHLTICLAEAAAESKVEGATEAYLISRLNKLIDKLNEIFSDIERSIESARSGIRHSMDQFFYELCEEQPGVVSVRQIVESFKPLTPFDYENSRPTSKPASGVHEGKALGIQPIGPDPANVSAYELENKSTGSSDSLTASDGETAERPHEELPDPIPGLLVDRFQSSTSPLREIHRRPVDQLPPPTGPVSGTVAPIPTVVRPATSIKSSTTTPRFQPASSGSPKLPRSSERIGYLTSGTGLNFRQKVDQWAARNPRWIVAVSYKKFGPENRQTYVCTYTLTDITDNSQTGVLGDPMGTKASAKESAAEKAFRVCEHLGSF